MLLILQIAVGMLLGFFLIEHNKAILRLSGALFVWGFVLAVVVAIGIGLYLLFETYLANTKFWQEIIRMSGVALIVFGAMIVCLLGFSVLGAVYKKYSKIELQPSDDDLYNWLKWLAGICFFIFFTACVAISALYEYSNVSVILLLFGLAALVYLGYCYRENYKRLFSNKFLAMSGLLTATLALPLAIDMMYGKGGILTDDKYNKCLDLYHQDKKYDQALTCFSALAEKGDVQSQYNVAVIYYNGEAGPADYKKAYIWFARAAKNGRSDAAEVRDDAAKYLTVLELEDAKRALESDN